MSTLRPTTIVLLITLAQLGACTADDEGSDPYADAVVEFTPAEATTFGHEGLPDVVLGPPGGIYDVASLGCGGSIVVEFDPPGIVDRPGVDFIVFENPFTEDFPEPGEVAVSADGERWSVFPCAPESLEGCAGVSPTLALPGADIDPTDPARAGGDGFDLSALADAPAEVRFVRILDRSSEYWDSKGEISYCDPGNQGAGGFDLDAVAAVH
ncbi:hypothetical protein ENSA5_03780 [Enhygromyxa salina]|uniref:Cell surface protein n=1 Tax=Enhygromyxa salina TaxID=215803 RepID=A0A2S9YJI2_9BACT|nr:cell surface protein [Enhygromyxa salina]PRQ05259.1 hypothetical protein ENSA5_03780 [Enhygromyxa salina]